MTVGQTVVTAATVTTVAVYAVLAGRWVSADPGWYADLRKPAWQPSPWVFGVVWPLNFLALAVSGTAIGLSRPLGDSVWFLAELVLSVVLALIWAWTFYVPHRMGVAAVALCGAALLTWLLVAVAGSTLAWAGLLLVPYAGWLTVAAALSVAYLRLARTAD